MKDLKAFAKDLSNDKDLAQKVQKAKNAKEVVSIAADNGYLFDESDLIKIAGGGENTNSSAASGSGGMVGPISGSVGDIDLGFLNFDFSNINAKIDQNINGQHNTAQNTGAISVSKGK